MLKVVKDSRQAYSSEKACWHTSRVDELRRGWTTTPTHIHLILSDLCNQDCHFCAYRMSNGLTTEQFAEGGNRNPNRKIGTETALELIDDFSDLGVKAVQFTGGGEPTVHPDHMRIFAAALGEGLDCALVTNGTLLREGWSDVLPNFKWIRVSVDAGSAETYARVRRVKESAYSKVLSNIELLRRAIDRQESDCLLGVGYVVTLENWEEIVPGLRRLKSAGAPYVRLTAMFSTEGSRYYNGRRGAIEEQIRAAKEELEDDEFSVVDLFSHRIGDLDQGAPDYEDCFYQHFTVYIGGNLKVYRCCTTSYTAHGEVGDLHGLRFKDWWPSVDRIRKYMDFDARSCGTCQFNAQNRSIAGVVHAPKHVNFV